MKHIIIFNLLFVNKVSRNFMRQNADKENGQNVKISQSKAVAK